MSEHELWLASAFIIPKSLRGELWRHPEARSQFCLLHRSYPRVPYFCARLKTQRGERWARSTQKWRQKGKNRDRKRQALFLSILSHLSVSFLYLAHARSVSLANARAEEDHKLCDTNCTWQPKTHQLIENQYWIPRFHHFRFVNLSNAGSLLVFYFFYHTSGGCC